MSNDNPKEILRSAKNILLIDWPSEGVPTTLLNAGFKVYSYSPDKYSIAELVNGHVDFRETGDTPGSIDIVNVYRPEEELEGIIEKHVLPLNAKVLWLHPPLLSEKAEQLARQHGLLLVQGHNIVECTM